MTELLLDILIAHLKAELDKADLLYESSIEEICKIAVEQDIATDVAMHMIFDDIAVHQSLKNLDDLILLGNDIYQTLHKLQHVRCKEECFSLDLPPRRVHVDECIIFGLKLRENKQRVVFSTKMLKYLAKEYPSCKKWS